MFHIDYRDRAFMAVTAETMQDLILSEVGWEPEDQAACTKLEAMGNGGTALVVTGGKLDPSQAHELMGSVIAAELENWVPGASQRLVRRAAAALGIEGWDNDPVWPESDCTMHRWQTFEVPGTRCQNRCRCVDTAVVCTRCQRMQWSR